MNRLPGFLRRKKGAKGQVVKPASPQKQQQQDDAYVDTDGGQSDVSFMSMGDGGMSDGDDSLEEQASLVTPKPGEEVQVGDASYNEEEFYSKSGGSAFLQDQFRMEDNKKAWDASLDADVQATAEMLAEQMRANPETAADVAEQGGEELGEFVDPLGLGVLNQNTMALESADSAKAGNTRRQLKKLARWQAESTMRLGKVDSDPQQDAASAMLSKLQTSSKQFDPWLYLSTAHANTPGEQLQEGLRKLEASLSVRKDQMRQLVKENFQRFIGCKGTIDDISHKLRENESVSNQSGSTKNVALAAADAQRVAQDAFAPILERQAEADAVRQKLMLLQRFEALFRLPGRVQELAADKDYQGVVTEYTKGKKLVPVKDHALWKEVARRLENETTAVCERLMAELSDTQSDYNTVIKAIQHVELLKAEGLAAAQASSPLAAFANSQREFLQQRLRFLVESHVQTVTSVVGLEASRDAQDKSLHMMPVQGAGDSSDSSSKCSTVQLAWLDLLQDLTNFFTKDLKLLLMMSKSADLSEFFTSHKKASSWKSGVKNMRNVLTEVQAHVQQELHSTLQTLWEEPDKHLAAHMTTLSILGSTRATVEGSGRWHDDLEILSDVAKAVLSHGVSVLEESMATWDADEDDWEMWRVHMSAASARHPVSAALGSVHNGACNAMLQFSNLTKAAQTLCKVTVEDVHARIAKAFLERLNDIARKMRTMLQDVRSEARAMLKEHQKQGGLFTIQPSSGADHTVGDAYNAVNAQMAEPMTAPMMALSLLSNTSFLIDHGVMNLTLPRLPLMYPGDPGAQDKCLEAVDKVIQTLKEVRDEASNLYVDLQSALLRASVKHYLTSDGTLWDSMPLKKELRDATYGMAFALVLIVNQVLSHATPSVQTLMGRLCQVIVGALHELLTANIRVMSAAALASLFLEMNFIEGIIPSSLKNDAFDDSIEQSYELMLRRLLELVKRKPPSSSSQLAQLLKDLRKDGSEMDQMESLHGCLEAYATKVLPAHAQRANMHFDCFKALTTDDAGGRKKPKAKVVPVWQKSRPKVDLRKSRPGTNSMATNGEYDKELLNSLVQTMTGKLEAMFADDDEE